MIIRAFARAVTVLGVLALIVLVATVAKAQVDFTTKGSIVVVCDGVQVSQHTVETEATESAIAFATKKGGKAKCMFVYPNKELQISLVAAPPTQPVTGSANITWTYTQASGTPAPTGFRIVYGTSPTTLTQSVEVANPAARSHAITNLAAGTYHFGVMTVSGDLQSDLPALASKTIQ